LEAFSATFERGRTTALVGPSGAGKSTIVGLLERWYQLDSDHHSDTTKETGTQGEIEEDVLSSVATGSITVGGHNINNFDLKWWRSQIGLVQQEPFLFNDTIENNVAFGLIGTQWEDAEPAKKSELVRHACSEAFADQFINKLPLGYSTVVGEGGIKLSGGQRQRIAIARSIIKQPAILILDEATSSIDVQGEKIVQKALDRASKDRTTIVIAHRLSTIRNADHIVVLRAGTKIEEGTHEQLLLVEDGLYKRLVQAQQVEDETSTVKNNQDRVVPDPFESTVVQQAARRRTSSSASSVIVAGNGPGADEAISEDTYQKKGFFNTVGALLYERRYLWPLFGFILVGAMGGGGEFSCHLP